MKKLQIVALLLFSILLTSSLAVGNISNKSFNMNDNLVSKTNNIGIDDDFYFVHITDTHVLNRLFDKNGSSVKRFRGVLDRVCSFSVKPAFVVVTGDLVQWGSGSSGALNYQALVDCLYEKDNKLYADPDFLIPVFTTPGNHDYNFNRNLNNYHKYIDRNHVCCHGRYVISYGDTCLFFLNSGPNYYSRPEDWFDILGDGLYNCDIAWLEDALNNCSSCNKIIFMHHPAVNYRNDNGEMYDVISRNRESFIELCEKCNVDLVLTGHTHDSLVFDGNENTYSDDIPLNCSLYDTLYVQTDDCKEGVHYRNISFVRNDIWLDGCVEVGVSNVDYNISNSYLNFMSKISDKFIYPSWIGERQS